jgi:hypothetical protein
MATLGKLIELRSCDEQDGEVTVYVKGFLARGEEADHFERWLGCHDALEESHGWGTGALGLHWPSGQFWSRPVAAIAAAKGVVDLVRTVRNVRRAARLSHWGMMLGEEAALVAARFVHQYWAAARWAAERADDHAAHLRELAGVHRRVRVVAHSLGCRHVIEAVAQLDGSQRPHEIHLCAPACREDDVAESLGGLARERSFLYFTSKDRLLDLAFTPLARGRALGFSGPERDYTGLTSIDVGEHFDFWVHAEYKNRFARIVPDASRGDCPTRPGQ